MRAIVESSELHAFARRWPCAHFPEDLGVVFEFDARGDLVDVEWFNAWSGKTVSSPELSEESDRALLALSQDAQARALAKQKRPAELWARRSGSGWDM